MASVSENHRSIANQATCAAAGEAIVRPDAPPKLGVCADPPQDPALLKAAARMAMDLRLPFGEKPGELACEMLLVLTPARLELRVLEGDASVRGGLPVFADLEKIDVSSAAGRSLRQPLAKAVGIKKRSDPMPTIIDATAGWGEDSWLLAALGCRVLAVERNLIIHTLLRDALLRAGVADPLMLERLVPVHADARHLLGRLAKLQESPRRVEEDLPPRMAPFLHPDVVFLDPMFPPGRKTAERKPMRVLRRLVGGDMDAVEVFAWAMRVATRRVVVKRPLGADPLGGQPKTTHKGKSLRYDVYMPGESKPQADG